MSHQGGEFHSTLWSLVRSAQEPKHPHRQTALNRLCEIYWPPVYSYLRRKGVSQSDAQDTTQGFFAHFLEKGFLEEVDQSKGRFKSYLLAILEYYLANERRRERAAKRGGGAKPLSLDFEFAETHVSLQPEDSETPVGAFRRSWALTVLRHAFDKLKAQLGEEEFDAVRNHLTVAGKRPSYEELSQKLGRPVSDVTNLLHRSRTRLRDVIHEILRETVDSDAALDEEVQDMFESL